MKDWYKNAIVYAIDVAKFADSNGDGWGDFPGLTSRLDYLSDLGVTCLWLLPFYPSPLRDNGYDVKNYYGVHDHFGTLEDFRTFLHRANEFGMRVIIDLVGNHTSDQHPWFQAACNDARSRFRNYYVWTESPNPPGRGEGSVFPGQVSKVWSYSDTANAYYYHRFYDFEPELDIANPEVRQELMRIMDFWLSFNVSGFRLDAVSHMLEEKGLPDTAPESPAEVLEEFRQYLDKRKEQAIFVGEADVDADKLPFYFGDNNRIHILFSFLYAQYAFLGLADESAKPLLRVMELLPTVPDHAHWLNFLRNLDELDMERLTSEERERIFDAFAPEESMQIFGRGMRRRLASALGGDKAHIQLALSLTFSVPGSPMITYGDEIGMGDNLALEGRKAVRTPMQWSAQKNAGFSDASPDQLVDPVIENGDFGYETVNVAVQKDDPDSLLNWVKDLMWTRRGCPEIGWGRWHPLDHDEPSVLAHRCEWQGNSVLVLHNFSREERVVDLALEDYNVDAVDALLGNGSITPKESDVYTATLPGYGHQWCRIRHQTE